MDPNAPKPQKNLPYGLTAANAIKTYKSMRTAHRKKAQNVFKRWMNSRKAVKNAESQAFANGLEQEFLKADPKGARKAIQKFKKERPTPMEEGRNARRAASLAQKRNLRIAAGETSLPPLPRPSTLSTRKLALLRTGGIAAQPSPLPPVYRPPILLPSQRNLVKSQGITALSRSGATRKKRRA